MPKREHDPSAPTGEAGIAPLCDSASVTALCERLATAPFIAVDFEFMRESTYYPLLCLIQVASEEEAAIIDPLAPGIELAPFFALLTDGEPIKVFHAGSQDIEIVVHRTGRTPEPVFDTQVAAMALGYGDQVSYQSLVAQSLKVHLDKGARFTDWSRRPLDDRQLSYALGDVTYLVKLFQKLVDKLRKQGRGEWLDEEMHRLADPANFTVDPQTVWQRIKLPSRKPEVLGRLRALAAWRERAAQARDLPRNRMMKDETLADIAAHPPKDQAGLARVRGLSEKWATNDTGEQLMAVLAAAQPMPREDMPQREHGAMDARTAATADLLRLLLKLRAADAGVAPRLIARADDLDELARGNRALPVLEGWRFELFGRDALAIIEGQLGFALRNGRMETFPIDPPSDC